ncbi:hypothetical protein N7486_002297 [Penicillium sp. IBT 16267x]|nr:hypothetical protein N7486_002297 [Penicillium sp. IBT 16267x]
MSLSKPFIGAVVASFLLLQLLFLANMSYLYGTAYHDSIRIKSMNVLFVDYDQGVIGRSVNAAYQELASKSFPTIHQRPIADYPTPGDVRQAICKGQLSSALVSPQGAEDYDNTKALTYVWNGAKYPAYAETIYSSLEMLVQATRGAYSEINGIAVMATANVSDTRIAQTLLDPISASSIDIMTTNQGVRFYYNTVSMVMPILQQFFFVMALNGVSSEFGIFRLVSLKMGILIRLGVSICYTFIASLCMTGYIWGFREDWNVNGGQFALTWMAIWLVMHLNFLLIDPVTAVLPTKFMPFAILTWIIINVSSSISLFDLSPGFYRVGYALPAYELYQLLLYIWTDGCNPPLHRILPTLFAWWLIGFVAFLFGMRKRYNQEVRRYTENDLSRISLPLA